MYRFVVAHTLALLMSSAALAGSDAAKAPATAPQPPHEAECAADVRRFCAAVPFGEGRRLACLQRHKAQLAPACLPRLKMMQEVFAEAQRQLKLNQELEAKRKAEAAKKQQSKKPATSGKAAAVPPKGSSGASNAATPAPKPPS